MQFRVYSWIFMGLMVKCKIIINLLVTKWWTQSCMKASSEQISAVFHQYETGVRSGRIRSVVINGCNHVNINSLLTIKYISVQMHFSHSLCTNPFFKTLYKPQFLNRVSFSGACCMRYITVAVAV